MARVTSTAEDLVKEAIGQAKKPTPVAKKVAVKKAATKKVVVKKVAPRVTK